MELDDSVTIHQRNFQILAAGIFKIKNDLVPEIMTEYFEIKELHYNFCFEASHFNREIIKSTHYGIQSVQDLGQNTWDLVPENNRKYNSLV